MSETTRAPSARREELLEQAYRYVLEHGMAGLSLRPLAAAIGSSPRVLLFLFGSKDGLIRALLDRGRAEELAFLGRARQAGAGPGLPAVVRATWQWLAAESLRPLLSLWVEAYARSLIEPDGPWAGFARRTVQDWHALLGEAQPPAVRDSRAGAGERTLALAILRGAMLELLATGDTARATGAVEQGLCALTGPGPSPGPA